MGEFVRNCWYAAAWRSDIGERPFGRRLLGETVVLFKAAGDRIAALVDRCPHRLLPLSMGECVEGRIRCGYHGMEFDGRGDCVHVFGQDLIPATARVRPYPTAEKYGLVWIWMGDPALADPALLPEVKHYGEPGWGLMLDGYQCHGSNYLNLVENLMDPAHTTFVHKQTIGNPLASDAPVQVERRDDHVIAYRWLENTVQSPHDRKIMTFDGKVDRGISYCFYPPGVSLVETCSMPAGQEHSEENKNAGLRSFSYKFLTPEGESSTHFFWLHVRNYQLDNEDFAAKLRAGLDFTYQEDNVIVSAIQREQEATGRRHQTSIAIDRGPTMVLNMIERMIRDEARTPPA